MNTNFSAFKQAFPEWESTFHVQKRDDSIFKRIECTWKEECKTATGELAEKIHKYHATINTQTGDIYLDCRKRKIFAKHLTLFFLRPIHTVIKTLWHATIIGPLLKEATAVVKGDQTMKELATHTFHSLSDIVRTPLYGLAITITHLAGILFGCISPNSLYKTRIIAGNLEMNMLRTKYSKWILSPCFSPIKNIAQHSEYVKERNAYEIIFEAKDSKEDNKRSIEDMLERLAKNQIQFRIKNRALFNDCLRHFPKDKTYHSAAKPDATK